EAIATRPVSACSPADFKIPLTAFISCIVGAFLEHDCTLNTPKARTTFPYVCFYMATRAGSVQCLALHSDNTKHGFLVSLLLSSCMSYAVPHIYHHLFASHPILSTNWALSAPMGCCCSKSPSDSSSPRTGDGVLHQPRSHVQAPEPRRGVTPVPQGRDATLEPAKPVQSGETIPTPTPPQPDENTSQKFRSGRQNLPSPPHRSTSAYPSFDNARMGPLVVEEPSHKSGGSILPSYRHKMNRSYSETPYSPPLVPAGASSSRGGHVRGYKQQNGVELTPDPRFATRATLKQAVAGGNNTRFPSTVRELLPDGFRFRILVLGKSQSGKSSLIDAVFNMAVGPFLPYPVLLIEYFY
ncbi:hypothetical protein EDB89DRAFT_1963512, partial [Lactarius sanguifluus]